MFLKSSPNHITLALIVHSTNEKLSLSWEAAIALWIRRNYKPSVPGSIPKHTIYALKATSYILYYLYLSLN